MNNIDGNCIVVDRATFPKKLEALLEPDRKAFVAILFITIESIAECKLSKDEESELLSSGWDQFLQNFSLPCECLRAGWREFWVIIEGDDREKVVKAFKEIFAIWDENSKPNLWHVCFTNFNEVQNRDTEAIQYFDTVAVKIVDYSTRNPPEKLFEIHIDSKSHTTIL
ncbi:MULTISPECIES: hypothetical protein [unclassified Roseofilum]|uniref:hypothetical protein n=1 Tax=unclassified Roseofilum TaxID=2620099 RepID=UPI000E8335FF|nr:MULTISPECIES: hypothetical protein [unclassified Roseofilum]HBR00561.1 hypothetical protein [Cyanobacteria bacterium UBA11691]MBP0010583.1 hypothetical protein [Roseofilum sp. Belize Diploria]MBP0013258.1 hypothetical protein [Roseofilum sp. SID3]MBP0026396.1 hypothetical protein [Roseofilum sp. SID2]MBP0035051.1 hypothetical protein [Roseofilum sp. Belize BBD 4]